MLTYCRYLNIFICTVVCWPCGDQEPAPVGGEVRWNVPPLVHRLTNSKQQNYKTIFLTRWLSSTPRQAIHVLFRVFPIIPSPEPEIIGFWAAVPDCSVLVDSMPQLLSSQLQHRLRTDGGGKKLQTETLRYVQPRQTPRESDFLAIFCRVKSSHQKFMLDVKTGSCETDAKC